MKKTHRYMTPFNQKPKQRGSEFHRRFDSYVAKWNTMTHLSAVRLEIARTYKDNIHKAPQPCDYFVVNYRDNNMMWIDIKECSAKKFYPSKQPPHQVEHFRKARLNGAIGIFIVWFKAQDPAGVNLRCIFDLDKPSTIEDGERFDWSEMF